jgi:phospholipase C
VNPHALGRCGYGPRLPLLVISPYAKQNFVDHTVTDQSSVIHFIEDNWLGGQRIGNGSFDAIASSISQMFNFGKLRTNGTLCLNPITGERQNPSLCGL